MVVGATQARPTMVTSAQLRAARAYLDWTMDKTAAISGLNRRTIIRLENDESYAEAQHPSLRKLVATYRQHQLILAANGLAVSVVDVKDGNTCNFYCQS
jgi:DNA-binding XRE family transcriptional regulator